MICIFPIGSTKQKEEQDLLLARQIRTAQRLKAEADAVALKEKESEREEKEKRRERERVEGLRREVLGQKVSRPAHAFYACDGA